MENPNASKSIDDQLAELEKKAAKWRYVTTLFFRPATWYIDGKQMKLKDALERKDVEEARALVNSIEAAALLGIPVGILATAVIIGLIIIFF